MLNVMQLPSLNRNQPTQEKKVLTCYITDTSVTLAVWEVNAGAVQVLSVGTPKEWQEESQLADAIEFGVTELKEKAKGIGEVLLGLPEEWVKDDDILPQKKTLLKNISKQTHLTPVGFVLSHEALWKYLSVKSGAANSSLFFEVSPGEIVLSLIENGQSTQHETVGRSELLIEDFQEAIARINKDLFPPQVFFFSSILTDEQLNEIKNEFLHFDWVAKGHFTRIPEVEVLKKTIVVQAISEVGGQEILKAQKSASAPVAVPTPAPAISPEKKSVEKPVPAETDFGFEAVDAAKEDSNVTSFGLPVAVSAVPAKPVRAPIPELKEVDQDANEVLPPVKKRGFSFALPFFKKKPVDSAVVAVAPRRVQAASPRKLLLPVLGVILIVGALGGYLTLRSQVRADVKIVLKTETVQKDVQIALDPNASSNSENQSVLKAEIVKKEASGSQETSTTGSKLIGEKAKGTVTIYNGTENTKTFAKGTEFQANNKKFLLDEEVVVASATAKIDNNLNKTLESGKKDAKIVAADIGADYNQSKETEFVIANFSKETYMARNEKDIAGGTSRESQAVAKEDPTKLMSSLKEELTKQIEKELNESKKDGEYIVVSGKSTVTKEEYSAKVGDETQNLKLTATVEAEAYIYQAQDLKPLAQNTLVELIPDGGALLEDTINILSKQSQTASSSARVILDAQISAQYTPPTNSEQWIKEIAGRTLEQAQRLLEGKPEISSVEIIFKPGIAKTLIGNMPKDESRINLIKEVK